MDLIFNSIHDEITKGHYECLICFSCITPRSAVWNCRSCHRIYDLKCIKEWGARSTANRGEWNCPHCLAVQPQKVQNLHYRCWCGKQKRHIHTSTKTISQKSAGISTLESPHSCGQTCGAKRECPHPCPLPCHAGPHAKSSECLYLGPKIPCFCGKETEQVLCSQSRYGGYACKAQCGKVDRICKHKCTRQCHERSDKSDCGPCQVQIKVKCHCGEITAETRACSSLSRNQRSKLRARMTTTLSCGKPCNTLLSCGIHRCNMKCHNPDASKHICPFAPFEGEKCFCGKVDIHRKTCTDPRTSCGETCDRPMDCGHRCAEVCHDGPCPPCKVLLPNVSCRCGATVHEIECGSNDAPICTKKCDTLMSCKRHRCRKECCAYSAVATAKSSARQNRTRNVSLEDILSGAINLNSFSEDSPVDSEAEQITHFCSKICGRLLSCGSHTCPRLCHAGKCGPCLSTSFDEWSCPCGRTIVEPPIRCGTVMPQCRQLCLQPQECGHSAQHLCHSDSEACSPCPVMVKVPCICGKSVVKEKCNQLQKSGGMAMKSCSVECGLPLPCGHRCKKLCCIGNGNCPPCSDNCEQKYSCGHEHDHKCSYPSRCPEECRKMLVAVCPCGYLKCPYECGEEVEIGCNEECLKECYPNILIEAYEYEKRWFLNLERQIRSFIKDRSSKTLWFKPMNKQHRRFVYLMLEHYGLEGESVDSGEFRSVRGRFTDSVYLCKTVLQNASKIKPCLFIDQIQAEIDDVEIIDMDIKEVREELSFEDGFVEVTKKGGRQNIENENNSSDFIAPTNQFILLE